MLAHRRVGEAELGRRARWPSPTRRASTVRRCGAWCRTARPLRHSTIARRVFRKRRLAESSSGDCADCPSALTKCSDHAAAAEHTRDALENQFGLADRVVDPEALAEQRRRFREQGITLPTFAELADPSTIDPAAVGDADKDGPDATQPVAGPLVQRPRRRPRRGARSRRAADELTGVDSPIIVVFGDRFPMITAHKVLAAYACLAPRVVTGQFDPTRHRAIWPSPATTRVAASPSAGSWPAAAWRSCRRG